MKRLSLCIVISLISVFCTYATAAENNPEPTSTRGEYIKHVAQLLGIESSMQVKASYEDYVVALNDKGFSINTENLNTPITEEEKSALINKVINYKLESREKAPEGIQDKAIIDECSGAVSIMTNGSKSWVDAQKGMQLVMGDSIKTGPASFAYLRVGKFGRVTVRENSELTLRDLSTVQAKGTEQIVLNLTLGETVIDARDINKNSRFEVQTPTTLAAVRGTIYSVKITEDGKTTRCE